LSGSPKAAPAPAAATAAVAGAQPAACEPNSAGASGIATGAEEAAPRGGAEEEAPPAAAAALEALRASSIVAGIGTAGVRAGPKDTVFFFPVCVWESDRTEGCVRESEGRGRRISLGGIGVVFDLGRQRATLARAFARALSFDGV